MFRQKRRNFESLYLELQMLEFEIVSTIMKLVTVVFVFYHCMYLIMADDGEKKWSKAMAKSQLFFFPLAKIILSYFEPFLMIFNLPKGRLWSIQCFFKLVTTLHGGNEGNEG